MPERFRVSKSEDPNIIFGKYSDSHISEDEDRPTEKLLPSSNNTGIKKATGQDNSFKEQWEASANETRIIEQQKEESYLANFISPFNLDVSQLKKDVSQLKTDVSQLKTDVGEIKTHMSQLNKHHIRSITPEEISQIIKDDTKKQMMHLLKQASNSMEIY